MISLLGMLLMGIGFVGGLGITASVTVAVTVAASITLLPALLGFAGDNIERTKWRGLVAAGFVAVALVGAGPRDPRADPDRPRPRRAHDRPRVLRRAAASARCSTGRPSRAARPSPTAGAASSSTARGPSAIGGRRGPARPRHPGAQPAPRVLRREQLRRRHHHQAGLRPRRRGLRQGLRPDPIYLVAAVDGADQVGALAAVNDAVAADPEVESVLGPAAQRPDRPDRRPLARHPEGRPAGRGDHRSSSTASATTCCPPVEQAAGADVLVSGLVAANVDMSRLHGRADADLLRRRAGAVVPAADGRVPVAARAAQGRDHEPAVDRRRLRRDRRPVPVGLAQRPHRRAARARSRPGCR